VPRIPHLSVEAQAGIAIGATIVLALIEKLVEHLLH
jgi:hypothetical protein